MHAAHVVLLCAVRGEKRHTEVVEANLAPIWDETMIFDFMIESQYQLDTEVLRVEVWDSDRIVD